MKKRLLVPVLFCMLALLGCSKDEVEETKVIPPTQQQAEKLTNYLVGEWSFGCDPEQQDQTSTYETVEFGADGVFVITTKFYLNLDCSGNAADIAESKGEFLISGIVSARAFEVDMNFSDFEDGDIVFVRARISQQESDQLVLAIRQLKFMNNGEIVAIPPSELEKSLPVTYFKL